MLRADQWEVEQRMGDHSNLRIFDGKIEALREGTGLTVHHRHIEVDVHLVTFHPDFLNVDGAKGFLGQERGPLRLTTCHFSTIVRPWE